MEHEGATEVTAAFRLSTCDRIQAEVTSKSKRFAQLVAAGATKVDAYDQSYGNRGGKQSTRRVEACVLSKQPEIANEIAAWEERLTPLEDLKKCKAQMLSNIADLALRGRDERVRLAASRMLVEYAEEHEGREASKLPAANEQIDALLDELLKLRADPSEALELEVVREGAAEPEDK